MLELNRVRVQLIPRRRRATIAALSSLRRLAPHHNSSLKPRHSAGYGYFLRTAMLAWLSPRPNGHVSALAEQAGVSVVKNELLELASVCNDVANRIEDHQTSGQ